MYVDQCHIKTLAGTTTIAVSVCPRCGTIAESGRMSCCGRGGSWFKNCGGVGNAKLHHAWYEGIQACKARSQSKTVIGQQLVGAQGTGMDSSQGVGMANDKAAIAATNMFTFTSVSTSTSENVPITKSSQIVVTTSLTDTFITSSTHTSVSTSMTTLGYVKLFKVTVYATLMFTIIH